MNRPLIIAISLALIAAMAVPALGAIPVRSKKADSPAVYRVVPETEFWVLRPSGASSVIVAGSGPLVVPFCGFFHGFGYSQAPVYVYPSYPLGPPTFVP